MNRKEKNFKVDIKGNPLSIIIGLLIFIIIMVGLFTLTRFIFTLLYYISPILIVATAIIDHKVIVGYFKWLVGLYKREPLMAAGATLLSIFGFPVLSAFLLGKALLNRRIRSVEAQIKQQKADQFIDYEEIESTKLELPKFEDKGKS